MILRLVWLLALAACAAPQAAPVKVLSVLTLNIQVDARDGRLPGIVDLIRRSGADVVAMQEIDAAGPEIARQLGWRYARLSDGAVVSKYELGPGPGDLGVRIRLPGEQEVLLANIHLYYKPYQPYQLLGIPYEDGRFIRTEEEALAEAEAARGQQVRRAIEAVAQTDTVIVTGDFNEPSHLDWTDRAAAAGRHPIRVRWPASSAFAAAGFKDSYRQIHPDEMAKPGYTWTPGLKPNDPKDHADRIDFVLYRGPGLRPRSARIVGESSAAADIVVTPYPTDHRGVLVEFVVDALHLAGPKVLDGSRS